MKGRFTKNEKPDPRRMFAQVDLVSGQKPVLEYLCESHKGKKAYVWRLWVSYDQALEYGTYLTMYPDGSISCFTIDPGRIRSHPVAPIHKK